jgi:hypothetical protein
LVRFTVQSLTGGSSVIPTIGETCGRDAKTGKMVSMKTGTGLWVSIPAGLDSNNKPIPEGLLCIAKDDCRSLNAELQTRRVALTYSCLDISTASTCVRGLCGSKPAQFACCLK